MSLASIDEELFAFFDFYTFCIISSSIYARDMRIPPFAPSHRDESNKVCFVSLRSQDRELLRFNVLKN